MTKLLDITDKGVNIISFEQLSFSPPYLSGSILNPLVTLLVINLVTALSLLLHI